MPDLPPELSAELRRGIAKHRLEAVAERIFTNAAAECYAMVIDGPEDYACVGNTRFGGDPDLPLSLTWPCDGDPSDSNSRFSNFIAQINFEELPPLLSGSALPARGILYLFVREMDCAAEPVLLDSLYYDGDTSLLRRRPSPDEQHLCDEYLVDLYPQKSPWGSGREHRQLSKRLSKRD